MKFFRTLIISIAALVSTVAAHAEAPRYTYVDLGPIPISNLQQCCNVYLNQKGWVAGTFVTNGIPHSFLFDGKFNDLGSLQSNISEPHSFAPDVSYTYGLNDNGDVIGESYASVFLSPGSYYTESVGFVYLYKEKRMFDLNSLVNDLPIGTVIKSPALINNQGNIVTLVQNPNYGYRTYLLNPIAVAVPEPKVSALFFAGLLGLLFARKRYVKVV